MTHRTVAEMLNHHRRWGADPAPVTLPDIHVSHRHWDLGPNEGIVSQAWRVQVVDTPTDVPTPYGRWLDVQYVQARRDIVTAQAQAWYDEPWDPAYVSPPRRARQTEITDPELAAAFAAADARYGTDR